MLLTANEIRQQVLKDRGIVSFKEKKKQHHLQPAPRKTINPKLKTPLMKYFEVKKGKPIEEILLSGSLSHIARQLDNEVEVSTISKWIKRLKLRYSKDNLPQCDGCHKHDGVCDGGVCHILIELEQYQLLLLKRKEIIDA